ncbi:hypothetical protein [Ferruginibacter sp.]|nr:hypothetical protein [Ferruginibacter sp.]
MTLEELENIDDPDPSKLLEREKLELEIKQLKQSYFRKSIAPILLQAGIGLTIALISIYLAYKSNLFDVKEKNIDAKTKYNETLLKTIELTQKRELLDKQVKEFEIQKGRLLEDSTLISSRLDSMAIGITNMVTEKKYLQTNIQSLTKNKVELINELEFSVINKNLQDLKLFPSPFYKFIEDLVLLLKSDNLSRQRAFDSLLYYTKDSKLKYISNYVLYMGTANRKFKDNLLTEIPAILKMLYKKNTCLNKDVLDILSDYTWNTEDKYEITKTLLYNYNNQLSTCGKTDILQIISEFGYDDKFFFSKNNYNLFWDYLKYNRDIFTSEDSLFSADEKRSALVNISIFCPQLYFSLLVKSLGEKKGINIGGASGEVALVKSFLEINNMPDRLYNFIWDFGKQNNLMSDERNNPHLYYLEYYNDRKLKIDTWLFGNFEKYRNDSLAYFTIVKNKTF